MGARDCEDEDEADMSTGAGAGRYRELADVLAV